MKLDWMQAVLISCIILIVLFLSGCQQQTSSKQIIVTDYDAAGNVIQEVSVPTTGETSGSTTSFLQSVWVPEQYGGAYVQGSLPNIPSNAVTRTVRVVVTNTGNINLDAQLANVKFQGGFIQ